MPNTINDFDLKNKNPHDFTLEKKQKKHIISIYPTDPIRPYILSGHDFSSKSVYFVVGKKGCVHVLEIYEGKVQDDLVYLLNNFEGSEVDDDYFVRNRVWRVSFSLVGTVARRTGFSVYVRNFSLFVN